MRSERPPRFKPWSPPKIVGQPAPRYQYPRSSPRARGLDARWDKLSIAFRRRHPFCRLCAQEGRDELTAVVDHILPRREYPQLKYDWKNLQGLCRHHDGIKAQMEMFARANNKLELLPTWCADPATRPAHLRGPFVVTAGAGTKIER